MRQHRPVIADLIRNPEGQGTVAVILALRQYPQGGRVMRVNKTTPTNHHQSHGQP